MSSWPFAVVDGHTVSWLFFCVHWYDFRTHRCEWDAKASQMEEVTAPF